MRVLIIGGTRFIGPALVAALRRQGATVAVFHRGRTEATLPSDVTRYPGDRADADAVERAVVDFGAERVIDMVAYTAEDARTLVSTCAGHVERLAVVSSLDVYRAWDRFGRLRPGPVEPVPLTEDAPLRESRFPRREQAAGEGDYRHDYDKLLVEQTVQSSSELSSTIVRLPFVFGAGDYRGRVRPYLDAMAECDTIQLDPARAAWQSTRAFVDDAAAAIALAATSPRAAGRVYNVGDEQALTELAWLRAIARAADWRGEIRTGSPQNDPAASADVDWAQHLVLDTTRIRRELGFRETTTLEAALERSIAWERAGGGHTRARPRARVSRRR